MDHANKHIETISVEAAKLALDDPKVTFVDLRDIREIGAEGMIPGAFHMPRGMTEFWVDPNSPYYKKIFESDHKFVFYCNKGWRSALATHAAQDVGLKNVCHIEGGFTKWAAEKGQITEKPSGKSPAEKEGIYALLPFVVNPKILPGLKMAKCGSATDVSTRLKKTMSPAKALMKWRRR